MPKAFALIFSLILLTGCQTKILDARGPSDVCEIHHSHMQPTEFKARKSDPPSREYLEARVKSFIHSYPRQLPPRSDANYLVFICDACVYAEGLWLQAHPQVQR